MADEAVREIEVMRQQRVMLDRSREAFGAGQSQRVNKEQLAQLLVPGVSMK